MLTRRTFVKALSAITAIPVVGGITRTRAAQPKGPKVGYDGTLTVWKPDPPNECTWLGRGNPNDWNDPNNWLGGLVPRNGDDVHIVAHTPAPTMPDGLWVRTLIIDMDAKICIGASTVTSTIYCG